MSTMPATHGHNEACCNIPPVVSTGYKAKGSYDEVDGMKTCKRPFTPSLEPPDQTFIANQ